MATYTYSIANDTASGVVSPATLHLKIKAESGLEPTFEGIQVAGDNINAIFTGELSAGLITALTNIIASHTGEDVDADTEVDEVPSSGMGSNQGYQLGSIVINNGAAYILVHNTPGSEVWSPITNPEEYYYNERYQGFTHISENWVTAHTWTTPSLTGGRYRVGWSYLWSGDSRSSNFEAQILVDTTRIYLHQEEPQDSSGYYEPVTPGAGCDQAIPSSGFAFIDLSAGAHTIKLQTRAEDDDEQVSIHRNVFEIKRVGNATSIDPSQNLTDREEHDD